MKRITKMIAGFLAFSMLATAPESTSAAKVEQGGTKRRTGRADPGADKTGTGGAETRAGRTESGAGKGRGS